MGHKGLCREFRGCPVRISRRGTGSSSIGMRTAPPRDPARHPDPDTHLPWPACPPTNSPAGRTRSVSLAYPGERYRSGLGAPKLERADASLSGAGSGPRAPVLYQLKAMTPACGACHGCAVLTSDPPRA